MDLDRDAVLRVGEPDTANAVPHGRAQAPYQTGPRRRRHNPSKTVQKGP